ncbi:sensor histidine kinase [Micropruina sp.]|uniref:sensor histidine kinase n=1 Tax=Micropruina sp. TaxID=2737536 RepID=UPI0039E5D237
MDAASRVPWAARLLLALAAVFAALGIALAATSAATMTTWVDAGAAIVGLGLGLLGLLLARERGNAVGWLLLASAVGGALLPILDVLVPRASGIALVALTVLGSASGVGMFGLFTLGVLLFPDGRAHGRLGRVLVPVAAVALALLGLGGFGSPLGSDGGVGPLVGVAAEVADVLLLGGFALILPLTALAAVTATLRRRAATGDARRGLRGFEAVAWINAVAFLVCGALSALLTLPAWFGAVADQTGLVFAVAAWVGIVRYRLLDVRAVIAGALPYLLASALVAGLAAGTAATLGTVVAGGFGAAAGAVVAALVALLLREPLQAVANLIVYGSATDPATAHARRLEQALRDSHQLLIDARDDERRRIRRDLHDGLGPTLAGLVLGIEHVERHLDDPDRTRAELLRLREAGQGTVQEVRRIVYALRPPALDSLGLAGAIREQAGRLGAESVHIMDLPELPETLEIGVYLIALEAMKNAATHARPAPFRVRLDAAERLRLEVHDDGPGLPEHYTAGVGIDSMRERAAELGGTLDIRPLRPRGTLVLAEWALSA